MLRISFFWACPRPSFLWTVPGFSLQSFVRSSQKDFLYNPSRGVGSLLYYLGNLKETLGLEIENPRIQEFIV